MSEIGKSIDQVVNAHLTPRLRQLGYKKDARIYHFSESDHMKVVQISASRWNLPRQGSFEIMLGVYFPAVAQVMERPSLQRVPRFIDCTIWSSIGRQAFDNTQDKRDIWYEINLDLPTDLVALASKVGDEWEKYGQPWFDRMINPEEAALELERFQLYFEAIAIHLSRGNHAKVSKLIARVIAKWPEAEDATRLWVARHGFA